MKPLHSGMRHLLLLISPFVLVVLLLALLGMGGAYLSSAVRAYVGGESLWSKAQRDAVYELANYARSHNAGDYQQFLRTMAVQLGDKRARIELQKPAPDLALARHGLLVGGNHVDDVDSMIWLFVHFQHVGFMADAIAIWAEADAAMAELEVMAAQLNQRVLAGETNSLPAREWLEQLKPLSARLNGLESRFSARMGEASRTAQWLIQLATVLLALFLSSAAALTSWALVRRQRRAEQALRVGEERMQRAIEASGLALWDMDVDSGRVYLSPEWSLWLGGPAEVTHTSLGALFDLVPEIERDAVMQQLSAALTDPRLRYRVEHRVRRRDGEWFWNRSEGRVVERDADGVARRMVGTNRDVTERKQAEATRLGLEAQLRESQKMEAVGTLAAGIAHDFNNILGGILGNLALMRDELGENPAARANLVQINKAALRARTLVQQILAFSRKQSPQRLSRPLRPLVEETLGLMRSTLPAGVALESRLADEPIHGLVDETQIQQVLMNLCTNAWHALHGQAGSIVVGLESVVLPQSGRVWPAELPAGGYAHLWVSDTGSGMDAQTQKRIFEPFFTTKQVGLGTGLGLSVAHGIVNAHLGAISVDSALGRGTTIHLLLPLAQPPHAAVTSEWGTMPTAVSGSQGQQVLYIDDDEVMLVLVERLLQRMGYRVRACNDPRAALELLRVDASAFALVISDFNMPGLSGLDVARELRQICPQLPLVISSGHLSDEQRAALAACGVQELIRKEFTLEELGPVVRRLIR